MQNILYCIWKHPQLVIGNQLRHFKLPFYSKTAQQTAITYKDILSSAFSF